jgi:hypothetical protein
MNELRAIYDLHKSMEDNHVIVAYEGNFSPNITQTVLSLAEKNLDRKVAMNHIKRKAFHIAVECLQNISSHSHSDDKSPNSIFIIGHDEGSFFISSGNMIKSEKVDDLQRKLDQINSLDADGLKQLHMQAIKESLHRQDTSNAGLGLISIARKSGKKLEYQFLDLDKENSFFSFQATFEPTLES